MKTIRKILLSLFMFFLTAAMYAQEPPPPPPDHGSGGNVPGGGAAITGGIGILLALGAAYGGKKVYEYRKNRKQL